MKQKVIAPDCPRCSGALWFVPCPHEDACSDEHYECTACGVVWLLRMSSADGPEWLRFDAAGQVVEILPPRRPRFKRSTAG